jgi:hypothetical protein
LIRVPAILRKTTFFGYITIPIRSCPFQPFRICPITILSQWGRGQDVQAQFLKDKKNFFMDDHTKIMESNTMLPSSGLKKGMWALVEYEKVGNKRMAEVIQVPMGDVY